MTNESVLHSSTKNLPAHVARPLKRLIDSHSAFKQLHLISDILLGCFRLYGHGLIAVAQSEITLEPSLETAIESLFDKDNHGLWSTTIGRLIRELDTQENTSTPPELASLFGVKLKHQKQPKIRRMTIYTRVTDSKGRQQQMQVTNTPVELLIHFRNRYVGHGTVYSEEESRRIFQDYQPILQAFIESLSTIDTWTFCDTDTESTIHGHHHTCSESVVLNVGSYDVPLGPIPHLSVAPSVAPEASTSGQDNRDADDDVIIDTFPYFIAHPYQKALEETDGFRRLHLLKETFLNHLKYMGLIVASEYFGSDLRIGDINRAFKEFLYRPQFGHWNAFMRQAIHALNEQEHDWFVSELPGYYDAIETQPYASEGVTPIGRLIQFRNEHLGHGTVPSESESHKLWNDHFPILKDLLIQMQFCCHYSIVSSDKTISWRLMGTAITQINLRQKLNANVALLNPENQDLSLVPFFVLPGEYFTQEVSSRAKLMVYEQNTGSRIVFFSPESVSGETNNENVLGQLNLMIRDKEKREPIQLSELSREAWSGVLEEHNTSILSSLLAERKVLKGIYQERKEAEVALRSWTGAQAGLFFMAAEAGSGKTNLLVEMQRQYTKMGLDTVLLRGNGFRTPDLAEELRYRLNLSKDNSLREFCQTHYSQESPCMVLIDGGNEHAQSRILFDSILKFVETLPGGHIKIVLSWRVNTKEDLPMADERFEPYVYSAASGVESEDPIIARNCLWLRPFNKMEVEGAWKQYVTNKVDKVRRKPNFSYEELTFHDRLLCDQLDNPLLLRLFLELNHGKGLPKQRGFTSIWDMYHERLISR